MSPRQQKKKKKDEIGPNVDVQVASFSPFNFLSNLGRKLFGEPREKTPAPYNLFSFLSI